MWHTEVWQQIVLGRRPKLQLANKPSVKCGTDTVLTFLQGLGHQTDPLEGRFMNESQVRKIEFTGKHISHFSVGPCVEIPT